jgi:hypothetical protein
MSTQLSTSARAGIVVLAVLSLIDLAGPLLTDGDHPPMSVALVGSALGLASLVCIGYVWRGATRAVVPLVALRVISALTALPAFFVGDVPAVAKLAAGAIVVLTLVGAALTLGGRRPVQVAS